MYKKKILIIILVLSLVMAMPLAAFSQDGSQSYSDIDGHWARHMIEEFTVLGYLEGYRDGTFRPDHPVTRAEAGAFVARLGFPELYPLIVYSDLREDNWYYESVKQATQTGFVHGYPDGTYRPQSYMLREEATKLASLFWGQMEMDGFEMEFNDMHQISHWAFDHMCKLVKMELLDGYPDKTIRPQTNLTRAEFVKLFYMILVEPKFANVTVRAVDINNRSSDLIEPISLTLALGDEATFEAPVVSDRWYLIGNKTQIHPVTQDLEVIFTYDYPRSSSSSGNTSPTPQYTLTLEVFSAGGGSVNGGGNYPEGTQITINGLPDLGYEFYAWYKYVSGDYETFSNVSTYTFTMPAEDVILQAVFIPETSDGDCHAPTLIPHSNYNVDQIMTITYNESEGEFDVWRSNISQVVIWRLRYEGNEPIPEKLIEIDLPNAGIDLSTPGQVTLNPSLIEELQMAGYNYQIDILGEQGCETSVIQYIQAGTVNYLSYLPYRGMTIDFDQKIYPSIIASYNWQSFTTTKIEVSLYDQYDNPCLDGPSYSERVYAFEGGGAVDWEFDSKDGYFTESELGENIAVTYRGIASFYDLKHTIIDGTELGGKYITFRAYLPGEIHDDESGVSVTVDTSTFDFLPVN